MINTMVTAWDKFFHSRVGLRQCRRAGWIRIAYAALYVIDRLLLTIDLDWFLSPTTGMVPYRLGRLHPALTSYHWTAFQLAPESELFLWALHVAGLLCGILLLLGIAPRFQLLGVYLNLLSFERHNQMIWDGEDEMFRIWAIFLFLMPLHHVTIWECCWRRHGSSDKNIRQEKNSSLQAAKEPNHHPLQTKSKSLSSWPMWPFRLFQIEVCLLYYGATISKLDGPAWIDGTALYMISYTNDFYPGLWNPEFLFDTVAGLKFVTWSALAIEGLTPLTAWIPSLRFPTVLAAFALHIGIDITMNMHCFEWLAMIGWSTFLIQPDEDNDNGDQHADNNPGEGRSSNKEIQKPTSDGATGKFKWLVNLFLAVLVSILVYDTLPVEHAYSMASPAWKPLTGAILDAHRGWHELLLEPYLVTIGLDQGVWNMFHGNPDNENSRVEAYITLKKYKNESNETETVETTWQSPDWENMTWWQRKRMLRHMTFYESLEEDDTRSLWVYFAKHIAGLYKKDDKVVVERLELVRYWEQGPPLPPNLGWREVAHQPMVKSTENMLIIYPCVDAIDSCDEWKSLCHTNHYIQEDCRKTCGVCPDSGYDVEWPEGSENDEDEEDSSDDEGDEEDEDYYDDEEGEDEDEVGDYSNSEDGQNEKVRENENVATKDADANVDHENEASDEF